MASHPAESDAAVAIGDGRIVMTDRARPVSGVVPGRGAPADPLKVATEIPNLVPVPFDVGDQSATGNDWIEKTLIPGETSWDPELSAGIPTGRAFALIGRACLRHLAANVPAMIEGDARAVHQMRVATRRLRAATSFFSGVVADDRIGTIKTEWRWLAHELGGARDLDTLLIEVLEPLRKRHANEPGLVSISKMFARLRLKSYQRSRQAVQSPRFRTLVQDTTEWLDAGPWTISDPLRARREMPIELYAAEQLSQRCKKIRRRGARLADMSPEQLHRLRVQVKKTRYATEFFSGVYQSRKSAKQRKKIRSSLMRLQECLGGVNDIVTHKALLANIITKPGRGLTAEQNRHRAYATGLVIGYQQAQVRHLLDGARQAHARFEDAKAFWKPQRQPQPLPSGFDS
jgi:triphosphatase